MSKKNSLIICMVAALSLFVEMGCATKKYVQQQVDPVRGRVDEWTEVSKRNENAMKDVYSRAQSGIQSVQAKATEVDGKAVPADQKAVEAQQMAKNAEGKTSGVETRLNH